MIVVASFLIEPRSNPFAIKILLLFEAQVSVGRPSEFDEVGRGEVDASSPIKLSRSFTS